MGLSVPRPALTLDQLRLSRPAAVAATTPLHQLDFTTMQASRHKLLIILRTGIKLTGTLLQQQAQALVLLPKLGLPPKVISFEEIASISTLLPPPVVKPPQPATVKPPLTIWLNPTNQRYYAARIQRDLLANWTVILTWGKQGTRTGRTKIISCTDQAHAVAEVTKLGKLRLRRGYCVL